MFENTFTGLIPPFLWKELDFHQYMWFIFFNNDLRWEMVVGFPDIMWMCWPSVLKRFSLFTFFYYYFFFTLIFSFFLFFFCVEDWYSHHEDSTLFGGCNWNLFRTRLVYIFFHKILVICFCYWTYMYIVYLHKNINMR